MNTSDRMNRRRFVATASLAMMASRTWAAETPSPPPAPTARLEKLVTDFLSENEVAGAQLAVGRNGTLLWSKGFGMADKEKKIPVASQSLFRIASISKPLTAVAILTYIEEGKLTLDANMLEAVKIEPFLVEGKQLDERVKKITIRHLLNHTSGWDRDKAGDQMFMNRQTVKDMALKLPVGPKDIIRWSLGRDLQFDPGERYAYSNLGYCILGRILENLSGQPYEKVIHERVFRRAGITVPKLGASLTTAEGEVRYHVGKGQSAEGDSVFSDEPTKVPTGYGTWNQESLDAHGGWISSAEDMVRFAMSLPDVGGTSPFHKKETWDLLAEPPPGRPGHNEKGEALKKYYALGFRIEKAADGTRITHSGSLPGTTTNLWRRGDGYSFALFFNQRCKGGLDAKVHEVLDQAAEWA